MCIIIFSQRHPDYNLILISNRDENFDRETRSLHRWPPSAVVDNSDKIGITGNTVPDTTIIAGQDVEHGGTWMAVSADGRLSALTNFKAPITQVSSSSQIALVESTGSTTWSDKDTQNAEEFIAPVSRGYLPISYLSSPLSTAQYLQTLVRSPKLSEFGGFSLLCCDLRNIDAGISIISNQQNPESKEAIVTVMREGGTETPPEKKTYALSNSLFGDPWPKTRLGTKLLDQLIESHKDETTTHVGKQEKREALLEGLFRVLSTNTLELPIRGAEDLANSIFIPELVADPRLQGQVYGTRQQTVILLDHDGRLEIVERTIKAGTQTQKTEIREVVQF